MLSAAEEENERHLSQLRAQMTAAGDRVEAISAVVLQADERADSTRIWCQQQMDETHATVRRSLADAARRSVL